MIISSLVSFLQNEGAAYINGVGLFKLESNPATVEKGRILPPRIEVVLDSKADGSSFDFIMYVSKLQEIKIADADIAISQWVEQLFAGIKANKKVQIDSFGTFSLKKGALQFACDIIPALNLEYEGMQPIDIESVKSDTTEEPAVTPEEPTETSEVGESAVESEPADRGAQPSFAPVFVKVPGEDAEPQLQTPEDAKQSEKEEETASADVEELPEKEEVSSPAPAFEPVFVKVPGAEPKDEEKTDLSIAQDTDNQQDEEESEDVMKWDWWNKDEEDEQGEAAEENAAPAVLTKEPAAESADDHTAEEEADEEKTEDEEETEDEEAENDEQEVSSPKKKYWIWILVLAILLLLCGGASYFFRADLAVWLGSAKTWCQGIFGGKEDVADGSDTLSIEVPEPEEPTVEPDTLGGDTQEVTEEQPPVEPAPVQAPEPTPEAKVPASNSSYSVINYQRGSFYVVHGSFTSVRDCEQHIATAGFGKYAPTIVRQDGSDRLRVCLGVFGTEEEASAFIEKNHISKAWTLK